MSGCVACPRCRRRVAARVALGLLEGLCLVHGSFVARARRPRPEDRREVETPPDRIRHRGEQTPGTFDFEICPECYGRKETMHDHEADCSVRVAMATARAQAFGPAICAGCGKTFATKYQRAGHAANCPARKAVA